MELQPSRGLLFEGTFQVIVEKGMYFIVLISTNVLIKKCFDDGLFKCFYHNKPTNALSNFDKIVNIWY